MAQNFQGIPNLPDLTHPAELIKFGDNIFSSFLLLTVIILAGGIVVALISFTLNKNEPELENFKDQWLSNYRQIIKVLQHSILVLLIIISSFFACSTLANRYHNWEQDRIAAITASVSGSRLEQYTPQVRYVIEEPYTYTQYVDDKIIKVEDTRKVNRFIALNSSQIDVNIRQIKNTQDDTNNYYLDFVADYQVKNTLEETTELFFEITPPYNYYLLQNFQVQKDGEIINPKNPDQYSFSLNLQPQQTTDFRISYQAQGGSRWVYDTNGQIVSNFLLKVETNFPNADFASGIMPTKIEQQRQGKVFIWQFENNVSVLHPFGVFTATSSITNTGVLPRLLLLAPGIFLWWLLLLYLSIPLSLKNIAIAGGVFFACILALTYFSRVMDIQIAWLSISLFLLILVWGIGSDRRHSLGAIICTISGAIMPVFGLLIPYSGLTLSIAGLISVLWLVVKNWYQLI